MKKSTMVLVAALLASKYGYTSIASAENIPVKGTIPAIKLTASDEELHNELFKRYDFVKNNYQDLDKLIAAKKVDEISNTSMSNNLQYLKFYIALLEARFLNEKFKNEQTAEALEKLDASKAFLLKTMQEAYLVE
ncbi:MAG: hypothetical protein PHH31_02155 [Acidaminococcaceae bacterium]|nr:hypothetical protein [Acidaminococcaceae bacterium]MDD4721708.1 hypothetical protein [Acidaminococcaceae bacterium]